jgi:hypothetical protein
LLRGLGGFFVALSMKLLGGALFSDLEDAHD